MIVIDINQNQIDRAKELYTFVNLNGSIMNGQSNIYGALGEIIIYDFYKLKGFDIDNNSTFDYDLIIDNYKIDVKTKKTKVIPMEHYLCSISDFNIKQKCDFYFFLRVLENYEKCFLLGYKKKEEFFKYAKYNKKGTKDVNGFIFKDNCWNLEIKKLDKFKI
jgi:hypothetical protein